jgi:hypothetical protein
VLSTVVTSVPGSRYTAFHAAFITAAGFAVLGAMLSWILVHDRDAAATMVTNRPSSARS